MEEQHTRGRSMLRGNVVIAALAVLTAIEFAIAIAWTGMGAAALLGVAGLVKAALIIEYFMHLKQLWVHIVRVWYEMLDADPEAAE